MADPQIDLSAGLVPKTATTVPNPATGDIDLSAGLVPKTSTETVQNNPDPNASTKVDKPGLFERAYETSGIKGMVDQAKAKADQDEAVRTEAMSAIKAGKYGHAAETLLRHVAGAAWEGAKGPAGNMIEGAARGAVEHGKTAVKAAREGKTGEAIENADEAVPLVGQLGEQVVKPLATDVGTGNYSGAAGDVIGGAAQIAAGKGIGKLAGAVGEEAAVGPKVSAAETTPKAQPIKAAGERVQSEAQAVRDAAGKKVGAAKEAVSKSLPPTENPIFLEKGKLATASKEVLKDTADADQLAGAKDPDMADARAMADHLSKGKNAAGEDLSLDTEKIESMKRAFNQKIDALTAKAQAGGNATALRHIKNLKSAYMDDVYDAYEKYGDPKAAQDLRATSKEYANIVGDQTSGPARAMFKNQSPEKIVSTIVNSGARSQSAVESLVRNMSKDGQAVLRDSVLKNIYEKNTLPDGTIDMVKARKNFYSLGDTAKVLYSGDLKPITDFLDAASKEQMARAAKAAKPSATSKVIGKISKATAAGVGAGVGSVAGTPGSIAGAVVGSEAADAIFQNGKSGAVKIGISPTEKITLSPSQASANRPLITKFLKAKATGNSSAIASAYNALAVRKPDNQ
jgi:hypothetical protein